MAQEMVNLVRIYPAIAHQLGVFVDADVEQVRQQPDILAQRQRAVGLGVGPGRVVQVPALAVGRQAQLHADRIVARERALVHPLELQAHAARDARQRAAGVAQQQRAGAVGQHPAQEVRIEIGIIVARGEARTLEQARGQLAGHGQGAGVPTQFHALRAA